MVQLSHLCITYGKTIALTIWTFVGKVISLPFNTLSRFVIVILPSSKRLLILWLQSPSALILEPKRMKSDKIINLKKFEFKMGCKAAETTCNINHTFSPGTANECTVQRWFKKFCKGDESLEDEECSDWSSEVDNDQLRAVIKADPLKTTQKIAKGLNVSHSIVIQHLKQIVKMKELNKWVPYELTKNQKNRRFEVLSSLIRCNSNEPFLDLIVTSPRHFPKRNFFMNTGETITSEKYAQQIDEIHQKLQCLQPVLVNRMVPVLLHDSARPHVAQPTLQKLNKLGYEVLHHLPCSPDLSPGKHFHNQLETENTFQDMGFYTTGVKKLISRWQKCVDCSGSYFD
uniref:Mos1 transposase HTH domain-containing protein n=1 Tax=Capra hircus TaxID=9925 RepID=A0A452G4R7_CAPHI